MQRKILMTAVVFMVALWSTQIQATSESAQAPVRVSAEFEQFSSNLEDKVTFVMPDGSEVARDVKAKARISINETYVGLRAGSEFKYKIASHYGTSMEGVCKIAAPFEKKGKKLEAIKLKFSVVLGRNPKNDEGPWFTCQVLKKFQD
ncbi:MAG: hypothetical protein LCH26_04720 [Proteobacteria bacterium]|nr:hypothetical protein [Pseudomonadota bacterium]